MAKIAYGKLKLTKNNDTKEIIWGENKIEVKQYLPFQDKLGLITDVLNLIQDDNNFMNNAKLDVMFKMHIVLYYAEINFTEKQKEDLWKLYDLFENSGLLNKIIETVPEEEYQQLYAWTYSIARNIYDYRNSIYGILDAIKNDYGDLDLDIDKLREALAQGDNLELLKDVM